MSKLTDIPPNKKCWMSLNKLMFGKDVRCPQCHNFLRARYVHKYLWCTVCRRKYRRTAYKGSWLYGMKLTPRQLFLLLWCWQNRKSPDTACLVASISYPTVERWYGRFRKYVPDESAAILSGLVQIDESYFGKLKSKQPQTIVAGAIEPDTNKITLKITNSRGQEALEQFVQDTIAPGTKVVTDKWYAYEELPLLGYPHESWNHSNGQFAGTNQIERLWSEVKRYLRKLYGCVPTKQLQQVLNEWMARHNTPELFITPLNYLQVCLFRVR